MSFYARFDHNAPQPAPVLGFYDTHRVTYTNLPSPASLLELTEAQWNTRMNGLWAVQDGTLVPYTLPTPTYTPAQQADMAVEAGLTVTFTTTPALSGVYPCTPNAIARLAMTAVIMLQAGHLPGGRANQAIRKHDGAVATMTQAQIVALIAAIGNYVAALDAVHGGAAMPASSVTIAL